MRWLLTAALTALCSPAPDTLLFIPPRRISSIWGPCFYSGWQCIISKKKEKKKTGDRQISLTCRSYISTVNKSLTESLGWITSDFKGQTPATDFASFRRGKLGSYFHGAQQFGQEPVSVRAIVCMIHTSRSFHTASVSSARCVTAAP